MLDAPPGSLRPCRVPARPRHDGLGHPHLGGGRAGPAHAFRAAGGTLVDTAHGYAGGAAEEIIGDLLEGPDRDEVVLLTKAGISRASGNRVVDCSRWAMMRQLETSLSRMRTDHVDVWLAHTWDDQTPSRGDRQRPRVGGGVGAGTLRGRLQPRGVAGCPDHVAPRGGGGAPRGDSVEYSLVSRTPERELADASAALGFGLLPWSPLGRGVLGRALQQDGHGGLPAGLGGVRRLRRAARRGPHARRRRRRAHRRDRAGRVARGRGAHMGAGPARRRRPDHRAADDRPAVALLDSDDLELPEQIVAALDEVSVEHS